MGCSNTQERASSDRRSRQRLRHSASDSISPHRIAPVRARAGSAIEGRVGWCMVNAERRSSTLAPACDGLMSATRGKPGGCGA